jgi:hypothetical protein
VEQGIEHVLLQRSARHAVLGKSGVLQTRDWDEGINNKEMSVWKVKIQRSSLLSSPYFVRGPDGNDAF